MPLMDYEVTVVAANVPGAVVLAAARVPPGGPGECRRALRRYPWRAFRLRSRRRRSDQNAAAAQPTPQPRGITGPAVSRPEYLVQAEPARLVRSRACALGDPWPVDGGEPLRGVAGVLPDGDQPLEDPSGSGA